MIVKKNSVNGEWLPAVQHGYIAPQYVFPAWETQHVPAQEEIPFGTFLAGCTTAVSAAVMLDPRASKEAKAIAQMALGVSLLFVLNKAFELQDWPDQRLN